MIKKKICCLHPWVKDVDSFVRYLNIEDEELVKSFLWDEVDPDYVIATEHIYLNKYYFKRFKGYYKNKNIIFIFHGGEAVYPDMNIFDYALVHSNDMKCGDRIIKFLPAEIHYNMGAPEEAYEKNSITHEQAKAQLKERKFCNFIYSNAMAHHFRDELFYAVSEYKKVDSLGGHLNNTGVKPTRGQPNWGKLSIEQKSRYKFTIACENIFFEGATTEKIVTTFKAHSVPIYWGNPYIADEFNPDAFINCHDYDSMEEIVTRIKEIDENDELWLKMVTAPWKTDEQEKKFEIVMQAYQNSIKNIFTQDITAARRRPEGTFKTLYLRFVSREDSFFHKVKRKIQRTLNINSGL